MAFEILLYNFLKSYLTSKSVIVKINNPQATTVCKQRSTWVPQCASFEQLLFYFNIYNFTNSVTDLHVYMLMIYACLLSLLLLTN